MSATIRDNVNWSALRTLANDIAVSRNQMKSTVASQREIPFDKPEYRAAIAGLAMLTELEGKLRHGITHGDSRSGMGMLELTPFVEAVAGNITTQYFLLGGWDDSAETVQTANILLGSLNAIADAFEAALGIKFFPQR